MVRRMLDKGKKKLISEIAEDFKNISNCVDDSLVPNKTPFDLGPITDIHFCNFRFQYSISSSHLRINNLL